MRKMKSSILLLALVLLVSLLAAGCDQLQIQEVPTEKEYTYVNEEKPQAVADEGENGFTAAMGETFLTSVYTPSFTP